MTAPAPRDPFEDEPPGAPGGAGRWLVPGLGALAAVVVVAALLYRPPAAPTPADLRGDPMLAAGHRLFQQRCISCHGPAGRGDGPISASIKPPPGNLAGPWKHGDRPAQVLKVIADGVPNTNMAGWSGTFDANELRAVAAYCYHLAGRPVPEDLRAGWVAPPAEAAEPGAEDDEPAA